VGTTFTALLPASERAVAHEEGSQAQQRTAGGETVLLVEDEQALREVTRRILAAGGYRVIAAANGPEALSVAATHEGQLDLLLTDALNARVISIRC